MQLNILDTKGKETGRTVELPDEIFGIEPNKHVVYLAIKQYLGAQRQGTHKVKTRAEVKGSSKKIQKQKGTGNARKGNIRNPLFKGGGTVFGPKPHKYLVKLNKKEKDLAKMSALSYKAAQKAIYVVENFTLETPKTKEILELTNNLQLNAKKTILVLPENNDTIYLSTRNIPNVSSTVLADINTYDIIHADVLVLTEDTANIFSQLVVADNEPVLS